ncbi:MAG: hypothetical protein CMJ83_19805 [Planctomycetes bacterium]|nr:hypothetical protein [Planctomycetota bacterium]
MVSLFRAIPLVLLLVCVCVAQKLPYPQREAVRRQQGNVQKVVRSINGFRNLDGFRAQNPTPQQVKVWLNSLERTESLCKSIVGHLDKNRCDKNHPTIAKMHNTVGAVEARIKVVRKELQSLAGSAAKASSTDSHPTFAKDLAQTQMIIDTHRIRGFRGGDVDEFCDIVRNLPRVTEWANERWTHYQPFFKRGTSDGRTLKVKLKWAVKIVKELGDEVAQFKREAPQSIERQLAEAQKWMARAEEKKQPLMLKGGVRQSQVGAERDLKLLAAMSPANDEQVKTFQARLDSQREDVAKLRVTMKADILASARAPAAAYSGKDKEKIESMIRAAWVKAWPKDEILEIRFHRNDWKRNHKVIWNKADKAWEEVDKSYLTVLVIVKTSDTIATMFPAYMNRDNLSGSLNPGVQTKGGAHVVTEVLLKNL